MTAPESDSQPSKDKPETSQNSRSAFLPIAALGHSIQPPANEAQLPPDQLETPKEELDRAIQELIATIDLLLG